MEEKEHQKIDSRMDDTNHLLIIARNSRKTAEKHIEFDWNFFVLFLLSTDIYTVVPTIFSHFLQILNSSEYFTNDII